MKKSDRPEQTKKEKTLFEAALGIKAPWYVRNIAFDEKEGTLTMSVDFTGTQFALPDAKCLPWFHDTLINPGLYSVHDSIIKQYRYPDFFQHKCYLEIRLPRIKLPNGSVRQLTPSMFGFMIDFAEEIVRDDEIEQEIELMEQEFDKCENDLEVSDQEFQELIYKPSLPIGWKSFDYIDKLRMFHMLFLLLNKDFQKKFGEELREWFKLFKMAEIGFRINNSWAQTLSTSHPRWQSRHCKHCPSFSGLSCDMIFSPAELYRIAYRKDNNFIEEEFYFPHRMEATVKVLLPGSVSLPGEELALEKNKFYEDTGKFVTDEILQKQILLAKERYGDNLKEMLTNKIPICIYPSICLLETKTKLMKKIDEHIDRLQKKFFEENPNFKIIQLGHLHKKSNDAKNTYDLDAFAMYRGVFLDRRSGSRPIDLVPEYFPKATNGNEIKSAKVKITNYNKRAKNLIRNAWQDPKNFPGKFLN